MCWRGPDDELDVETITRAWLGWRRIECNGADMGGVHTLDAAKHRGKVFRPGGGRCLVELEDKAGRHWPHWERLHHNLHKALATFESVGLFG